MSDNFMQLILLTRYIFYNFIYLLIYLWLCWVFITVRAFSGGNAAAAAAAAAAKSLQLCPTLCDPIDCSPLGYCVHGIFQARILEWVAMPFSME